MIIDKNAREVIYDSMEKVSSIVGKTLGPNGRNIVISSHEVYLSNDGYTVCKNIHFDNEVERIGHELLTETSELTKKMAGDGTSSTICLATEIIRRIRKYDFYKIDLNQDIINTKEIILKEMIHEKICLLMKIN